MSKGPERRQHPRVPAELPLQYSRYLVRLPVVFRAMAAGAERAGVGWTCDLSESGMRVELDERLRPETQLTIRLYTDRGQLEVPARVIWAGRPGGLESGIPHGVGFTELPPEQRQRLHDMLLPLSMVPHADVRLPLKLPITCQRKDQVGGLLQGQTGNLSRAGTLVYLSHALSPGTGVVLSLPTSKGAIRVDGMVTWVEPPGERQPDQPIPHGVRFNFLRWSESLLLGLLLVEAR
jgi:hypothetical protein